MEWLATLFGALVIALIVGAAFSFAGARGPWQSVIWFMLILFLATLAIGVWADPVGPVAFGVPWLGFLVTAIFIGLLIAAATPDYRHGRRHIKELPLERDSSFEPETEPAPLNPRTSEAAGVGAATAVSVFFWIFAILAISIVLVRFLAVV